MLFRNNDIKRVEYRYEFCRQGGIDQFCLLVIQRGWLWQHIQQMSFDQV